MDKTYQPKDIEQALYSEWERAGWTPRERAIPSA